MNLLFKWKKKQKPVITLNELYDAVMEVAKEQEQDYINVRICKNTYDGVSLSGYIHGSNWFTNCKTIEELCEKLRNYRKPVEPSLILDAIAEEV